jgi:hypothetical protein
VKSQPALPAHRPLGPVMPLFLLSGFAGLLYEIVWMKLLTPVVGAALFSVTAVLTVFMGGLALGSLVGGRYLERATSPLRLYGVLEMLVGAYALAVPFIIRAVNPLFKLLYQHHDPALAGLDWQRVLVCGIVLLVPTTLMGATLPVLVRYAIGRRGQPGGTIAALYGINAAGAVVGALAAGFALIPALGLSQTTYLAALVNFAVGITAILIARRSQAQPVALSPANTVPRLSKAVQAGESPKVGVVPLGWICIGFSGVAAMIYQVAWTRVLTLFIRTSVYERHDPMARRMSRNRFLFAHAAAFMLVLCAASAAQAQAFTTRQAGNWNAVDTWTAITRTGTITSLTTSATVTGSGTLFLTEVAVGDRVLKSDGTTSIGIVTSVTNNTTLTLTANASNANTNVAYTTRAIPGSGAAVTHAGAYTVTIPSGYAATVASLTIGGATSFASILNFAASSSSLTVSADLTMTAPSAGATRDLQVNAGTLSVGGTLYLSAGASGNQNNRINKVTITTGTVTVSGDLVYNAGNFATVDPLQNQIVMSGGAGTFNLAGAFTINSGGGTPTGTITPGTTSTFNFDGTSAQTIPIGVSSVVYNHLTTNNPAGATISAAVTATNVTGNISVQTGLLNTNNLAVTFGNSKTLTVSSGATLDAGTSAIAFGTSGTATINGTFLTANANGFSGGASTAIKSTNSPTISLGSSSTIDYDAAGAQTVTGRTDYAHVKLSTSGAKTAGGAMTLSGNLTLGGSATFAAGTSLTHTFSGNWVVNTSAATPFSYTTSSTLNFNAPSPAAATSLSGSSTATLGFYTVNLNNTNGFSSSLSSSITGTLTVASNVTFTPTSAAVVSGSGTLTGNGTVQVTRATGSLDFVGQYSVTNKTLTNLTVEFAGAAAQGAGTNTFGGLKINNSSGVTLSGDVTVNGALTLTSGNITTGSNKVIISSTGTVARTSGHVVGNLQKNVATGATSRTFEVGDASTYTPVIVAFASVTSAGDLSATTTAGDHPNISTSSFNATKSVNRYWTLTNSGVAFTTYSATFTFVAGDLDAGTSTAALLVGRYSGASWSYPTIGTRTSTSTQATGITAFGDFQIAQVYIVSPHSGTASRLPSNGVTYTAIDTVKNPGSATDSYDLLTAKRPGAALTTISITGTGVTQGANPDSARLANLGAGTSAAVTVTYSVGGVTAGTIDTLVFKARSVADAALSDSSKLAVTVIRPNMTTARVVSPTGVQPPGTLITHTITITNTGTTDASTGIISDSVSSNLQFKLGSVVTNLPAGMTAALEYSNDAGVSWAYTPVSAGCSAPAGYDGCVNRIRWRLLSSLSCTPPNNTGNVQFDSRIR